MRRRSFYIGAGIASALYLGLAGFHVGSMAASPRSFASSSVETAFTSHRYQEKDSATNDGMQTPIAHSTVRGRHVRIAVIDSQIDEAHPQIRGSVIDRYDATGERTSAHSHGTGIAGAILRVAPEADILAVRVFSSGAAKPETTTDNILRGLEWAVNNDARIVNMSFAGPGDPALALALKAAYDKGVILIAAVGNAGSEAAPLFPASDPHVIAVTATDREGRIFDGANRGEHVAVAAPGVEVLVPAPAGETQITTGTSVAAAHVSGVVALMLETNPSLTPTDVRRIFTQSARHMGPSTQFGAGLVDPGSALRLSTHRSANTTVHP